MSVGKMAQGGAFKQSKEFTGGQDKKLLKALQKSNFSKKTLAREILWFFSAVLIALIIGFIVFYVVGEVIPDVFVGLVHDLGSLTVLYWIIVLFAFIGVYITRLIVWAIKLVVLK